MQLGSQYVLMLLLILMKKYGKNLGTVVDVFIIVTENNGRATRFDKDKITGTGPGGPFNLFTVPTSEFRVSGKSRGAYSRDFRITLRENTVFPIQITVGRDSGDNTSERVTDTFFMVIFHKNNRRTKTIPKRSSYLFSF